MLHFFKVWEASLDTIVRMYDHNMWSAVVLLHRWPARTAFGKLLRQSLPSEQGEDTQQHQYASLEMWATIDVIVPLAWIMMTHVKNDPIISDNSVLKKCKYRLGQLLENLHRILRAMARSNANRPNKKSYPFRFWIHVLISEENSHQVRTYFPSAKCAFGSPFLQYFLVNSGEQHLKMKLDNFANSLQDAIFAKKYP